VSGFVAINFTNPERSKNARQASEMALSAGALTTVANLDGCARS
jgi:hypothetical protein